MEGMAEYLSRGPIDPETAMWVRDAALEGHLPSIEEMTNDPYIFPLPVRTRAVGVYRREVGR